MVFPIVGGTQSTGYDISNSLKFNDNDSSLLSRAFSTNPSDQKLTTISFWFKIGNITSSFRALYRFNDGSNTGSVYLRNGNDLQFGWDVSSGTLDVRPSGVLRDPSAWYHCHIKVDTTQSTASNRVIIHINGVERTYSYATYPDQNATLEHLSNGETYYIGGDGQSSDKYFDGYITEFNVIDGQAKDYTDFGEFDDNGVWIPKQYTGTYGNNGFFLQFKQTGTSQNSSGIGADTSGNDLHWALANFDATDSVEDTCTNNFATLNTADMHTTSPTIADGNLDFTGISGTPFTPARSTIAVSQGKWYMEYKFKTAGGGVGVMTTQSPIDDHLRDDSDVRSIYRGHGGYYYGRNNSGGIDDVGGNSVTLSADDIVGIALDLDNGYVYFSKNGTYMNGQDGSTQGNPAGNNGSSGGAANHPSQLLTDQHDGVWAFMAYDISTATTGRVICNFGNPPYTPSSVETDANGFGSFEYAPPSGFFALCTKNLAEFG